MHRSPTEIDHIAESYLDDSAALDPIRATYIGIAGVNDLPDLSPDWWASMSQLRQRTLSALQKTPVRDDTDRATAAALRDELTVKEDLRAAGQEESSLAVINSPVQAIRSAFDMMPTATPDDWATTSARLHAVPAAIDGYVSSLNFAADHGQTRSRRQVQACVTQCGRNVGPSGFFAALADNARLADSGDLPDALRRDLHAGAQVASDAYARLRDFLRDDLLPRARQRDGVGRDIYALHLRSLMGTRVDLDEAYAWGQDELARIQTEAAKTAHRIKPGATVEEAVAFLDDTRHGTLYTAEAFRDWMEETSDSAIEALAGVHFEIAEPIKTLECRIAPTHDGVVYYTGPSEDMVTRPGRMWWSVPANTTEFSTWRERTTVYHEGVPGHHLQIAQATYNKHTLNRWRRLTWLSGHGEGWALYAERLMAELGFLDDPADRLGMLDAQALRAVRVVLDIGVHCDLRAPSDVDGRRWTYDKAWEFLSKHTNFGDDYRRFELDRYLGWPGQAPTYKLGERLWLELREEIRALRGSSFDLKSFHKKALDMGSVGMDVLRADLLSNR